MFYAQFVLAKKGPLARIWLAAHLDDKLKKSMVTETDIQEAVQAVIKPRVGVIYLFTIFGCLGETFVAHHRIPSLRHYAHTP